MMIRIRLKNYPALFVGLRMVSYAIIGDDKPGLFQAQTKNGGRPLFVPEAQAKVWTSIRNLRAACTRAVGFPYPQTTFSQYEAVYPDGSTQPLDEALKEIPVNHFDTGDAYLDGILERGVPASSLMARTAPEATVPVHWIDRVSGPHDFESLKAALTQHGFPFEVDSSEDEPGHTIVLTPIPGFSILIHADEDGNLMAPSLLNE